MHLRSRAFPSLISVSVSCFSHAGSEANGSASKALASLRAPFWLFNPSTVLFVNWACRGIDNMKRTHWLRV